MKSIVRIAALTLALCGGGTAVQTHAQTCTAPVVWDLNSQGVPPISGDTCTLPDSVALFCDFLDSSNKGDAIYQITLAPGFTNTAIMIAGGTATFNPVTFLYSSACTLGNQCASSGDVGTPLPLTGVAPGTYLLAATAAPADGSGACGIFSMTTNGTPVELQSFEVL